MPGDQIIRQTIAHCQFAAMIFRIRQQLVIVVNIVAEVRPGQLPTLHDGSLILVPETVQPVAGILPRFFRHVVSGQRLRSRLVFTRLEHLNLHLKTVQGVLHIKGVAAKAVHEDAAKTRPARVFHQHPVRMGGKVVPWLVVYVRKGINRLAGAFEVCKGAAKSRKAGRRGTVKVLKVQHQKAHPLIIPGMRKHFQEVRKQRLLLILPLVIEEGVKRVAQPALLHYDHTGFQHQYGFIRHLRLVLRSEGKHQETADQHYEQKVQNHCAQKVEGTPDASQNKHQLLQMLDLTILSILAQPHPDVNRQPDFAAATALPAGNPPAKRPAGA